MVPTEQEEFISARYENTGNYGKRTWQKIMAGHPVRDVLPVVSNKPPHSVISYEKHNTNVNHTF